MYLQDLFSIPLDVKMTVDEFKEILAKSTISQTSLCSMPLNQMVVSKRKKTESLELDYLEGHYVKRVLNFIFGPNWRTEIVTKETSFNPTEKDKIAYSCSVTTRLEILWFHGSDSNTPTKSVYVDVGHGTGTSRYGHGDAIESAEKEAVTDSLKRCAVALGDPFGLILYNKEKDKYLHRFMYADYGLFDMRMRELNSKHSEIAIAVGKFLLRVLNKRMKEDIAEPHEFIVSVKVCEFVMKLIATGSITFVR